jgi:hypothetical protein
MTGILATCLGLSGCAGANHVVPSPLHKEIVCPNAVGIHALLCGAGGGSTGGYAVPTPFSTLEQGVSDSASRLDDYTESGSSTDSSGNPLGSSSGSISQDPADGTDTLTLNMPSFGLNNVTFTRLDPAYFDMTQNPINIGDGVMLSMDQTTLDSSTTMSENGVNYTFSGAPDTDGVHYDVTITGDDGSTGTFQYNPADFVAPDPTTTQSTGIRPAETCTAGGYCQTTITPAQGAALMKAVTGLFSLCAIWCPAPSNKIAATAAIVTGAAAADLTQQDAQQKKKKTVKKT